MADIFATDALIGVQLRGIAFLGGPGLQRGLLCGQGVALLGLLAGGYADVEGGYLISKGCKLKSTSQRREGARRGIILCQNYLLAN